MDSIIIGNQNNLTQSWTVATVSGVLTGTLVVSGLKNWDLTMGHLLRIKDTTTGTTIYMTPGTTFSTGFTAGLPTFTWVIPNVPADTASGDTVLVYLMATEPQIQILLLQYQKA